MATVTNYIDSNPLTCRFFLGGTTTDAQNQAKIYNDQLIIHAELDTGGTWILNFYLYTNMATGTHTVLSKANVT